MKEFAEEAVVRIWRNVKMIKFIPTGHFGHAAVTVRGSLVPDGVAYVSWWPKDSVNMITGLRSVRPKAHGTPYDDHHSELQDETAFRLEMGFRQRHNIPIPPEWYAKARNEKLKPIDRPRSGQIRRYGEMEIWDTEAIRIEKKGKLIDEYACWGQSPEYKINLPGFGAHGMSIGLSTRRIAEWWEHWQRNNRYKLASRTDNCAGAAAEALKAGGADAIVRAPKAIIYMEPIQIEAWAKTLRTEIFSLNNMVKELETEARKLPGAIPNMPAPGQLWSPTVWKQNSAVRGSIRSPLLRKIDSAVEDFSKYAWVSGFEDKYEALIRLIRLCHEHLFEKTGSTRTTFVQILAKQVVGMLREPDARVIRLW